MKRFCLCMFLSLVSLGLYAQIKIESPTRDIEVRMRGCAADGDNVLVECLLTNIGQKDIPELFLAGTAFPCVAYDDEGTSYKVTEGAVGGERIAYLGGPVKSCALPMGVPVKCRLLVEQVNPVAASFALIEVQLYIGGELKKMKLRNIPINRE